MTVVLAMTARRWQGEGGALAAYCGVSGVPLRQPPRLWRSLPEACRTHERAISMGPITHMA